MPAKLIELFAGSRPARAAADAGLLTYARARVRRLDRHPAADDQRRTLLGLVRRAADTRFGREHHFARIRTVADYQARVPLRHYEDFWRDYWQAVYPRLEGVTWPGHVPYYAL